MADINMIVKPRKIIAKRGRPPMLTDEDATIQIYGKRTFDSKPVFSEVAKLL